MAITIYVNPTKESPYGLGLQNGEKTVFAGNPGLGAKKEETANLVEQKKSQAQRKAMKLVLDAWEGDRKSLQSIDDTRAVKEEKIAELSEYKAQLKNLAEQEEALQKQYGEADDSQKEELEQAILDLQSQTKEIQGMAQQTQGHLVGLTESIMDSRIERLKSNEILKAEKLGEGIKEAADREIMGLLTKDGMEHINEELQEKVEQAKEAGEKKEEEQEKLDETRKERELQKEQQEENWRQELEAKIEQQKEPADITETQDDMITVEEAQREIQKILLENHMLEEDLKGIEIDLNY
ncbi:MAG: hypothetical protein NC081_12440 [Roseburia sp.]|nr:hypothetical protein [Roseburia sp.]